MKFFTYIILVSLFFSCNEKTKEMTPRNRHTPKEIKHKILNDTAIILNDNGHENYMKMEYDSAIFYFKKSLIVENNPITYNELGSTYATQRKYKEALIYFKKGRETDSTYWPNYINESRTFLTLAEFDNGKKILNKMIKNCNSDYWISYANFYLALMHFNDGLDCIKVEELLEKSESMKSDSDLKNQYQKFYEVYKNNCS